MELEYQDVIPLINDKGNQQTFNELFGRRIGYSDPKYPGFYHVHRMSDFAVVHMDAESCKEFNVSLDEIIALGSDFQQLVTHPDDLNRVNHELNKLKAARDENRTVNFFQRLRFHQEDKSGYTLVVTTAKLNLKNNTFVCITNTTDQLPIFSKKVCNALNVKFQTEQYLKAYASLTKREKEIFNLLIEGKSKKEMAVILVRSIRTVEQHVKHIYRKIGVSTKLEAVKMGNFINQAIKHVIYLSLLPWFH